MKTFVFWWALEFVVSNFSRQTLFSGNELNRNRASSFSICEDVNLNSLSLLSVTHSHKDKHHLCYQESHLQSPPVPPHRETAAELCPGSSSECQDSCRRRCNEAKGICRALLSLDSSHLANIHTCNEHCVCFKGLLSTLTSTVGLQTVVNILGVHQH